MKQKVRKIEGYGIVFDHLSPYSNDSVQKILGIHDLPALIIRDYPSSKYGRKDVLKIEVGDKDTLLSLLDKIEENLEKIVLVSKNATINIIEEGKVVKKIKPLPLFEEKYIQRSELLEGVLSCENPNCISNKEPHVVSKFYVRKEKDTYKLKCYYCGWIIEDFKSVK